MPTKMKRRVKMSEGKALGLVFTIAGLSMIGLMQLLRALEAPGQIYFLAILLIGVLAAEPICRIVTHYAPAGRRSKRTQ